MGDISPTNPSTPVCITCQRSEMQRDSGHVSASPNAAKLEKREKKYKSYTKNIKLTKSLRLLGLWWTHTVKEPIKIRFLKKYNKYIIVQKRLALLGMAFSPSHTPETKQKKAYHLFIVYQPFHWKLMSVCSVEARAHFTLAKHL